MHSTNRNLTQLDLNRMLYPWIAILPIVVIVPAFIVYHKPTVSQCFAVLMAFFIYDNLGVQLGVHKLMAHRAFNARRWVTRVLAFLSILSGQGSPLVWVAIHVGNHHPNYESEKDLHSPRQGWWYAFLSWYWRVDTNKINFRPARGYFADRVLVILHRYHAVILAVYWLTLSLIGIETLVFVGLLPAALSILCAGLVNANLHAKPRSWEFLLRKYQNYPGDSTYNSVLLGFLTMGLGLHNNHHADPSAPFYDQRWFEVDLSRWLIPILSA